MYKKTFENSAAVIQLADLSIIMTLLSYQVHCLVIFEICGEIQAILLLGKKTNLNWH